MFGKTFLTTGSVDNLASQIDDQSYMLGDVKHGYGIFEWPNKGKRYEGHWLNGKQHGQGKLIKNDKVQSGIWEYGKLKIEDSN